MEGADEGSVAQASRASMRPGSAAKSAVGEGDQGVHNEVASEVEV